MGELVRNSNGDLGDGRLRLRINSHPPTPTSPSPNIASVSPTPTPTAVELASTEDTRDVERISSARPGASPVAARGGRPQLDGVLQEPGGGEGGEGALPRRVDL